MFSLVVKLTTASMTAASTLFLARHLGPTEYGIFALALGISTLLVLPADLGISSSASRFAAEHHDDFPAVARVIADATRLKFPVALLVSAALAALAAPIADAYGSPGLAWPLRGVALAVFGQSMIMLYLWAFSALRRVQLQLRVVTGESVVELGATVALVLLGGGAAGAAFGRAAGYLFGAAAGAVVMVRLLGRGAVAMRRGHGRAREIARYAGALFLVDAAFTLFEQIDVLLIGALLTTRDVGFFQAPLRLVAFLHYPGLSVASAVAPRMVTNRPGGPDLKAFSGALRLLVLIQVPLGVGAAVWAQPITNLALGSAYGPSADVIRALSLYVFLAGIAPLVSTSVTYSGRARSRVVIAAVTVVVNAAIDAVLIPQIGIVGGAVGTTVAYLIYVPWHLILCRSIFGFDLAPLARTLARSLLAGALLAGVLALTGLRHLSPLAWVVGGTLGMTAYVLGLVVTRELSGDELRGILSWRPKRLRDRG